MSQVKKLSKEIQNWNVDESSLQMQVNKRIRSSIKDRWKLRLKVN